MSESHPSGMSLGQGGASLLTVEVFLLGIHALGLCSPDDRLLHG